MKEDLEFLLDNEREWRRIIFNKVCRLERSVWALEVKSGVWGVVGGALAVAIWVLKEKF